MDPKGVYQKKLLWILFVLYLLALGWIIVFKLEFSLSAIASVRHINWRPFYDPVPVSAVARFRERSYNVLIFAPLGVFMRLLWPGAALGATAAFAFLVSVGLETAQYVWAVGFSDITDLITNTSGALLGFCICRGWLKRAKNPKQSQHVLTLLLGIMVSLLLALWIFLRRML